MKAVLATKSHMTQHFAADCIATPVTVLTNATMKVVKVKTTETDGYNSIVVGHGSQKESRISKPVLGNMKDLGLFRTLREFRNEDKNSYEVGQELGAEQFEVGDIIQVSGISKGKGFQGAVKRHGFKGKGSLHHARHALREVGSIGGGGRAGGRVVRGKKMPGRMGSDRITVKNLTVIAVDSSTNTMLVKGAVPGNKLGLVEVVKLSKSN
jgi:large subunit ribosomal protein L3